MIYIPKEHYHNTIIIRSQQTGCFQDLGIKLNDPLLLSRKPCNAIAAKLTSFVDNGVNLWLWINWREQLIDIYHRTFYFLIVAGWCMLNDDVSIFKLNFTFITQQLDVIISTFNSKLWGLNVLLLVPYAQKSML